MPLTNWAYSLPLHLEGADMRGAFEEMDTRTVEEVIEIYKEGAVRLLVLFHEQQARPGHLLKNLNERFPDRIFQLSDLPAAVEYAEERGWIEVTDQDQHRLTQEGFAAYHAWDGRP
jgi:hypothetical protein